MKKVYQTIFKKGTGNCMQASVASLFEDELNNVPHFMSMGNMWHKELEKYLESKGHREYHYLYNPVFWDVDNDHSIERIKQFNGVDGLFLASISSPKYNPNGDINGSTHMVLIDKDYNIVHDPCPEYEGVKYPRFDVGYNGIRQVYIIEKIR
jgi:hypothetical protein